MVTVKHTPGTAAHLLAAIRDLKRKEAAIGFFPSDRYADGTPVAYVATIQEHGYPGGGIPARPFFRPTIAQQRDAWRASLAAGARAVANGRLTVEQMLRQFAMAAAGDVADTISRVTAPPLSARTIAARRAKRKSPGVSTKPLVDTGLMIQSVRGEVVDK